MQRKFLSGGGVSRRFTRRLRGQSTVEYVLVIAIIGLVVLIAEPWVSSAIRNQFNTVAGTLGNGIDKGSWETGSTGGGIPYTERHSPCTPPTTTALCSTSVRACQKSAVCSTAAG